MTVIQNTGKKSKEEQTEKPVPKKYYSLWST